MRRQSTEEHPITTLKNHWITWLSIIAAGFMLVTGTAMTVTGGEFNETEVRVVGIFGVLGGLLALAGLVSLRSGLTNPTLGHGMIVLAMSILAIGYWWSVFVPPLVAVVVVWAGVINEGLSLPRCASRSAVAASAQTRPYPA